MIITTFKNLKRQLKNSLENDLWNEKRYTLQRYIKVKSEKEFIHLYALQNASTGVKANLQLLICLLTGKLKGEKHLQNRRYI
jgi:hypothetical protein